MKLTVFTVVFSSFLPLHEWSEPSLEITIPERRWAHHMIYDEANSRVLLYGGSLGNTILGDMWAWDGSSWIELTSGGPPPRTKGSFVYDSSRKKAVLFGGVNADDKNIDDTWEWDGREWKQIKVRGPIARAHSLGAYDYKNNVVLIFGGFGPAGVLKDSWSFDGKKWQLMNAEGPENCLPHGMIYDETRQAIVMITVALDSNPSTGKPTNEMWEWTGMLWKKLPDPTPSIVGLQAFAAWDKDNILCYDGNLTSTNSGTTWKYDTGKWIADSLSGPGPRMGHVMVFDKRRRAVVLFGGGIEKERFNDTWEWGGKKWLRVK
jgi:hypothetical protein